MKILKILSKCQKRRNQKNYAQYVQEQIIGAGENDSKVMRRMDLKHGTIVRIVSANKIIADKIVNHSKSIGEIKEKRNGQGRNSRSTRGSTGGRRY